MALKKTTIILLVILAVSVGLFGVYHFGIRNMLDTTPPVITVEEGLLVVSVKDPEEVLLQGLTAVDDKDGDVTDSLLVESVYGVVDDVTTVTYAAIDSRGNVSKCQRQVRYRDYESPKFQLYDSLIFTNGAGFDLMNYVGAVDVIDGDIRRRVRATVVSDTQSLLSVGRHQVKFQVTNSLGETVDLVLPVEVGETGWYNAEVELTDYLIYLDRLAPFEPKQYLKSFEVRGVHVDLDGEESRDVILDISGTVDTGVPGIYEVTYTLSQNVDLTTFTGRARLIVIVEY